MARPPASPKILAYLRTLAGLSIDEQRGCIEAYARKTGFQVIGEFCDEIYSDADLLDERPGFEALLNKIEVQSKIKFVIVLDAEHFARSLMPRLVGLTALSGRGVRLITPDGQDLSATQLPGRKLIHAVGMAFAEFEKKRIIKRAMRGFHAKCAADRVRKKKFELLLPHEKARVAAVVLAKKLRASRAKIAKPMSYREIAERLKEAGYVTKSGRCYSVVTVKAMIDSELPTDRRMRATLTMRFPGAT